MKRIKSGYRHDYRDGSFTGIVSIWRNRKEVAYRVTCPVKRINKADARRDAVILAAEMRLTAASAN